MIPACVDRINHDLRGVQKTRVHVQVTFSSITGCSEEGALRTIVRLMIIIDCEILILVCSAPRESISYIIYGMKYDVAGEKNKILVANVSRAAARSLV